MKQILASAICILALSTTAAADNSSLVYQTLTSLLQNGILTSSGKEIKLSGINDRGDSCELDIIESRDGSNLKNGATVRFSVDLLFQNVGDKSGYVYYTLNENPDSPRNQAAYDFATPIDGVFTLKSADKVSAAAIPIDVDTATFYSLGYNHLWTSSQVIANSLLLVQKANPGHWGGRTFQLNLSSDRGSIISETIISQLTNSVYTCKFN